MSEYELVCQAMPYTHHTFDLPSADVEQYYPSHLWHSTRGYVIDPRDSPIDEPGIREATL